MTTSTYEAEARQRKVDALLDEIAEMGTFSGGPDVLADALHKMPPAWWRSVAQRAGVRPPSLATIAAVAQAVRDRSHLART